MKRLMLTLILALGMSGAYAVDTIETVVYAPGQYMVVPFTLHNAAGVAVNGDATPTVSFVYNYQLTGLSPTLYNISTGVYVCRVQVPTTYKPGDFVTLVANAVVSGVTGKAKIWHGRLVQPYRAVGRN